MAQATSLSLRLTDAYPLEGCRAQPHDRVVPRAERLSGLRAAPEYEPVSMVVGPSTQ